MYMETIKKDYKKVLILSAAVIVILAIAFIATLGGDSENKNLVNEDLYQAVFLNNGEVYFGHLTTSDSETLVLEDIYYLRATPELQQGQEAPATQPQINLIKLGEEIHGPEDRMVIPMKSVTYWENLLETGQVSQAIAAAMNEEGQAAAEVAPANVLPAPVVESEDVDSENIQEEVDQELEE